MGESVQPLPSACPSCGATVRSDVPWCTQCYASLRDDVAPQDETEADPAPHDVTRVEGAEGEGTEGEGTEVEGGQPEPGATPDAAEVERVAEQLLARLATDRDELRGLASRLPSSPGARAVLVAVVIVVATSLIVLLMFIVGALL